MKFDQPTTLEDGTSAKVHAVRRKQPTQPPSARGASAYLIIALDGTPFAIDASLVRHIDTIGRVFGIPSLPAFAWGVTRVRDRLIPLIDLRVKLGLPRLEYHPRTCLVEVDVTVPMAVAVDSVLRVSYHAPSGVVPLPMSAAASETSGISGVLQSAGRTCLILDIQRILIGQSAGIRDDAEASAESRLDETPGARSATDHKASTDVRDPADPSPRIVTMSVHDLGRASAANKPLFGLGDDTHDSLEAVAASLRDLVVPAKPERATAPRQERLTTPLARHVMVGTRRVPGYRRGDPRLQAMAAALVQMPPTFRTTELAPAVATWLGRAPTDYRLAHCRYDLGKLRARNLAERIGSSRSYRLTCIGRTVCEVLHECRSSASVTQLRPTRTGSRRVVRGPHGVGLFSGSQIPTVVKLEDDTFADGGSVTTPNPKSLPMKLAQ